jgi:AcrR family transcriptional regulator
MPSNTRKRLIDAARQQFYRDGFRNVGIDAILKDVGISKTAFYKHFESKDDLMVAVLEDVDRFLQQTFREMVQQRGGGSAAGQLRAILDVVQQIIEQDDFHGCIFVNAAMEFPLPHDPAHQAAAKHKQSIEQLLFELGERAGAADPQAMAQEFCLILEGAYVTRSVTRDVGSFAVARRLTDELIARHLPAESASSRAELASRV